VGKIVAGSLADRMKSLEGNTRVVLPRRTNMVIRVDGRAFHSYTRGLRRPYDAGFMAAMDATAIALCEEVQGSVCAYVQSDEISVIAIDYQASNSEQWLGGVLSKITSLSAAHATAVFNQRMMGTMGRVATFDSRAFPIDDVIEVNNYLLWRQHDARRNAIGMISDAVLGHAATRGVKTPERTRMLEAQGVVLDEFPPGFLQGRFITAERVSQDFTYTDQRTGKTTIAKNVLRRVWRVNPAPDFRQSSNLLQHMPARAKD